jgi:putative transposase
VPHDAQDEVVDFVRRWSEKTEIGVGRLISWLGIRASKFYDWRERYGRVNEHNGWIPRDFWLEAWEKAAIIQFHRDHPFTAKPAIEPHESLLAIPHSRAGGSILF